MRNLLITGKGLADLIREEYGFRVTFVLMTFLLVADLGNTVAEFAGLASGMAVLGVHRHLAVPLGAVLVWALVLRGTYRVVERVFLVACVFYVAYPLSGFLAHPDWEPGGGAGARPRDAQRFSELSRKSITVVQVGV